MFILIVYLMDGFVVETESTKWLAKAQEFARSYNLDPNRITGKLFIEQLMEKGLKLVSTSGMVGKSGYDEKVWLVSDKEIEPQW